MKKTSKFLIAYYSGTGGTAMAANCFARSLAARGFKSDIEIITDGQNQGQSDHDFLIFLFPVHACNAPASAEKWLDGLKGVSDAQAVIISVSGGGEIVPNTACRTACIKKLENKGYKVIYEKMLVMPTNCFIKTDERLAAMLLEALPAKVEQIVMDIDSGIEKRLKPRAIDRFISRVGKAEVSYGRKFGKAIQVSDSCNGCGWCSENCPSNNITMAGGRPVFSDKCHLCLCCIYGCKQKALAPGKGKFFILENGYDLDEMAAREYSPAEGDLDKMAKGYLWSGVRKYLSE